MMLLKETLDYEVCQKYAETVLGEIWTTSQHEAVAVPLRTQGRQVFSVTHGYEKRGKGLSRDQRSHNTNGIFGQFVFLTHRFYNQRVLGELHCVLV